MRSCIILTILYLQGAIPCIGFGVSREFSGGRTCLLPWQTIAEKVLEGGRFCENKDLLKSNPRTAIGTANTSSNQSCNYAYRPNQPITVKLPEGTINIGSLRNIEVDIAECVEGSWGDIGKVVTSAESNEMSIAGGIGKEGFFKLSFAVGFQGNQKRHLEAYVIVSGNWKKDILAFCRALKEHIETNPDPQLIRSCISVSHFDHTMEVISEASVLSVKVLKVLNEAVRSKQDFNAGKCPDLVIGLNKIRLKRFEGSTIEEFVIFVPESYTSSKAWPVFVHTAVRRWAARNNYSSRSGLIDLWWHTILYKDIRWKDFTTVMEIIKQKLNIDEDRVYVEGICQNGLCAAALALNYPDQWAECNIELGNSYRYLAGNSLNLPLMFVRGGHRQEDSYAGFYNFTVKCFQYNGCRHFKYDDTQSIVKAGGIRGVPIPESVREKSPQRVLYTIESLRNPRAYWVTIDGRENEDFLGTIDASVDEQTIFVKTSNVDAYSLDLIQAPLDSSKPVEIVENGHSLGTVTDKKFTKRSQKYINAAHIKNHDIHGPICDAFTDPYMVAYGTMGEDALFIRTCKEVAEKLANGAPCFADVKMPRKMLSTHNLILVGSAESNCWLAQISEKLPVQTKDGRIYATNGKSFDGDDLAYLVIHPNPMNPDKYVAAYSATSNRAIANIFDAYSQMKSIRPADVGIFEIASTGSIKWHIIERFNTVWDWHSEWDRVLVTVNKKHPKWQWRQWIAKTVRTQLDVDVAICEDPFSFDGSVPSGQITYRDMFNVFKNVWFTKVEIDGKSLREFLTVPFASTSKREVDAPIIDGISLLQEPAGAEKKLLTIGKLVNHVTYTAAMPEKCLNGNRMGLVIQDYDIVDQAYLIPMLKESLMNGSETKLDDQLDGLKLRMY